MWCPARFDGLLGPGELGVGLVVPVASLLDDSNSAVSGFEKTSSPSSSRRFSSLLGRDSCGCLDDSPIDGKYDGMLKCVADMDEGGKVREGKI